MDKQIDPFPPHDSWDCMAIPACLWVSPSQCPDSGKTTAVLKFTLNEQVADLLSKLRCEGKKIPREVEQEGDADAQNLLPVPCSVLATEAHTSSSLGQVSFLNSSFPQDSLPESAGFTHTHAHTHTTYMLPRGRKAKDPSLPYLLTTPTPSIE